MLKRFLIAGAALGLLVPAALWARTTLTGQLFGLLEVSLWPPSILLMATENSEGGPTVWLVMALAVLLNVLWYTLIAGIVYAGFSLVRRVVPPHRAEP
jgi:hypothetical protein